MAAKWQRWMPMEIDALKASPAVQAMHPCARAGYVWLLLDAWQTEDCTIPTDPIDLADKSGLGDELWAVHGLRILRKFEQADGSNRLRNLAQYERWKAAKVIYEKRQESAHRTNELRSPSQIETVTVTQPSRSPYSGNLPLEPPFTTETKTSTKTEKQEQQQKPSRAKRTSVKKVLKEPDSRHQSCKEIIFAYYKSRNDGKEPPWDGREGKALGMLLNADPAMDAKEMRRLLHNRYISEVVHGERPGIWIGKVHSYSNGPLDEYGKLLKHKENKNATVSNGTGNQIMGVLKETLERRQRNRAAGEDGDVPSGGESGRSDVGFVHAVPSQPRLASISGGDAEPIDF